ncbi:excisionase-like protein [Thermacetogenium phaeum DSM 12270]|jgi:excisionase family DNA binding protein/YgiT-type zinc finger domain-containing protein|uniref:Excisionase-like protein n=1 Tax=Thermacetogenium phaeum (strain ATCC BAA-254 / DSM 26808 / PB) TaxID=1089553 RepID=K4LEI8_THEPS|nr:helix-turn-helix domain-containing protein [Thermacetogenium phaeum]AFV10502.1 excisionase-like protein [Thermacetogenium phaeum DSM 12270]
MECYICGGEMKKNKKDVDATWKGRTITFRGMNAWVCSSCGEEAYEPDDVRLMQGLIRGTLNQPEYPEIMNVSEVAELLRVSNQTVYNLVKSGRLPATKVGREWRFSREKILQVLGGEAFKEEAITEEKQDSGVKMAARKADDNGISERDLQVIQRHLAEMGGQQGG